LILGELHEAIERVVLADEEHGVRREISRNANDAVAAELDGLGT